MHNSDRAAHAALLLIAVGSSAAAQTQVSGNAFNPAISLILNGRYAHYSLDPSDYALPGFPLGGEAGLASEGLSLDETEFAVSANVDDKYYGFMSVALTQEDGETAVGLEEAYFETLALPMGFKVKGGKFLSDVGYLNPIHAHAWDFVDAPLAYAAFLDGSLSDTGLQLKWVAPTILFVEIGAELLRGDSFPAANGAESNGTGASSLFFHVGADVGSQGSWRAGVSRLSADANMRTSDFDTGSLAFTGTSDLTIVDFVWKWAKNGNPRDRYFIAQAEYLSRDEDGTVDFEPLAGPAANGPYSSSDDGYYVQGVYQFRPRWRVGIRYDSLDSRNDTGVPTPLATGHEPSRVSVMSDFSNSEFSRLRLQFSRDESRLETDNQIILQYIMSLGAHGAHRF